jgi:hypothetical protein
MAKHLKVPGHKRAQVVRGFRVVCECNWASANWYGTDGMKNAHAEYYHHLETCAKDLDKPES